MSPIVLETLNLPGNTLIGAGVKKSKFKPYGI